MSDLKILARAIEKEDLSVVQRLIQQGIDLNSPFADGALPIIAAVKSGNVDLVRLLTKAGIEINVGSGSNLDTPLTVAASRGFEEIVQVLIEGGADVNRPNALSLSPLCIAASRDSDSHLGIVRTLTGVGADINAGKGATPLMCACSGLPATVQFLINAGADVNAVRRRGTALHIAIGNNNSQIVQLLLQGGAKIDIQTPSDSTDPNLTALEFAKKQKRRAIISLLEKWRGDTATSEVEESIHPRRLSWDEFRDWLHQHSPTLSTSFQKAVKDAKVSILEEKLGHTLPDPFKRCYLINNGQKVDAHPLVPPKTFLDSGYRLLPIQEVYSDWRTLNDLLDKGEFEGEVVTPDKGIRKKWWDSGWLPFAGNGNGDYLCLDLNPTSSGTVGQIISVSHESGRRELIAADFETWTADLQTALQEVE